MMFSIVHSTCYFHKEGSKRVCEKVLELNNKLDSSADFKASTGWLKNFKSRHELRELHTEDESLSGDKNSSHKFKEIFLQHVKGEGYPRDDICNGEETGFKME
ncbi:HTH CENPB-type domain-containing protein [Trichonephila clavipes]|nr:HTH CENPB-type domain-containing protein [Trichonephila clavipes]